MTQNPNELNTPWSLQFDRDGTEDFGIICDAEGNDMVASHLPNRMPPKRADREFGEGCFWLPEQEDDPVPLLVRQMQLMTAAPKLLEALQDAEQEITNLLEDLCDEPEEDISATRTLATIREAIAGATDGPIGRAV